MTADRGTPPWMGYSDEWLLRYRQQVADFLAGPDGASWRPGPSVLAIVDAELARRAAL